MEPPGSILDDYFSLGIFLILALLAYAFVSLLEHSFNYIEDPKSGKKARHIAYFLESPQIFEGTAMQFSLIFKLLIVFLSMQLLNSYIIAGVVAIILIYAINEFIPLILKGDEGDFFYKSVYITTFMSALAAPFNKIMAYLEFVREEEREEREVQSIEEITEWEEEESPKEARERMLLKSIVSLSNTSVHDIMKPRVEMAALSTSMTAAQVMELAVKCGYSRLPVYEEGLDNIKGFLYIKDMVHYLINKEEDYSWQKHIREAYFVPGSKKIGDLLEEFRQKKIHLALVADEYGGTDGIVTLEDVLEEIVGEISDETDKIQ